VTNLDIEWAGAGEQFTTYNFSVAEYGTYFAGDLGVWVHNSSSRFCDTAFGILRSVRKKIKKGDLPNGVTQPDAASSPYLAAADWVKQNAPGVTKENVANLYAETFDDILREDRHGWLDYYEGRSMPNDPGSGKSRQPGHTIAKHVGKTIQQLQDRFNDPSFTGPMASTFVNQVDAEDALTFFMSAKRTQLINKSKSAPDGAKSILELDVGRSIGFGVDRQGNVHNGMHKLKVVVIFDGAGGWLIQTAHPVP
jgi:hypothetical protein